MKRILALIISLILCFSSFQCAVHAQSGKDFSLESWMASIPDEASLGMVNLPGTHDSGTFNVGFSRELFPAIGNVARGYVPIPLLIPASIIVLPLLAAILLPFSFRLPSIAKSLVSGLGQCVDMDISEQLSSGLRGFDLRLAYNYRQFDDRLPDLSNLEGAEKLYSICERLRMMHGSVGDIDAFVSKISHDIPLAAGFNKDGSVLTMKDVINDCRTFLSEHPSETVLIFYKNEGSIDERIPSSPYNAMVSALVEYADSVSEDDLILLRSGDQLPTMQEARGNIYLIFSHDCGLLENEWDVSASEKIGLVSDLFMESDSLAQSFDGVRLSAIPFSGSQRVIYTSTYYDMRPNIRNIFFGGDIISGSPKELATEINRYIEDFSFRKGHFYGWIMMNFPSETAIRHIIESNQF